MAQRDAVIIDFFLFDIYGVFVLSFFYSRRLFSYIHFVCGGLVIGKSKQTRSTYFIHLRIVCIYIYLLVFVFDF